MSDSIRFRRTFTPKEYFAIDDASDERHEYSEGFILAMSDEAYDAIPIIRRVDATFNTSRRIRQRLGNPDADRLVVDPAIKNRHLAQPILYGPLFDPIAAREWKSLPNRTFIIELAEPEVGDDSRVAIYREAIGQKDFVLISQRHPQIRTWTRDGELWHHRRFDHAHSVVPVRSLGVTLLAAELYAGLGLFEANSRA